MSDNTHKLSTKQMIDFVSNGFIRLDELVPEALCQEILEEVKNRKNKVIWAEKDESVYHAFDQTTILGKLLRLPRMQGTIESLVGANPRFDHFATHLTPAGTRKGTDLHQDAEYDRRPHAFDIQISIFPTDVTEAMGGTLFVPGTHFRRVYVGDIRRYQNVVGQVQTVCKAGTVVFWHHNLWHSARSNLSDLDRYMLKLRINPSVKQERLWDTTSDSDSPGLFDVLQKELPWQGNDGRMEIMQRIKLWRYLTGDESFDLKSWWTRVDADPFAPVASDCQSTV
ncbi:phytanoyl-CoA dioxygenase family protein [Rubellicoccus peritrichatus]|uniref:Phytanoyl-CoA dioxygenase family protein n=1 Tax=Rubellicoccus peritrichatus TaxID=3080537 RepID=A0AAQ3QXS8_9BACT|nr:phytanoyl-CoA dioxygenase family protein [Puniceicoccus sp. CR14]WOO43352.1 phytanoyl-CoA dioxygenase family protein [Puniceicoccus sp. CR14]